jgi:ParB family transcriptional regulator, chromosome partitioning protein
MNGSSREKGEMNTSRITGDSALARTMSKSNEWYTPPEYIKAVRQVLGLIELDPASCKVANQIVKALNYYDCTLDGLQQSWKAKTVYLNPPYGRDGHVSNQEIWSGRLIQEYEAGNIEQAILLVSAATDAGWFHRLWNYPICFTKGRIRFVTTSNSTLGPTIGSAFVYLGTNTSHFVATFRQFGAIVQEITPPLPTLWKSEVDS